MTRLPANIKLYFKKINFVNSLINKQNAKENEK